MIIIVYQIIKKMKKEIKELIDKFENNNIENQLFNQSPSPIIELNTEIGPQPQSLTQNPIVPFQENMETPSKNILLNIYSNINNTQNNLFIIIHFIQNKKIIHYIIIISIISSESNLHNKFQNKNYYKQKVLSVIIYTHQLKHNKSHITPNTPISPA